MTPSLPSLGQASPHNCGAGGAEAGPAVRFVNAIHAPQDESCFAIYEADSPAAITVAGRLAGIAFDRIVEIAINDASDATGQVG